MAGDVHALVGVTVEGEAGVADTGRAVQEGVGLAGSTGGGEPEAGETGAVASTADTTGAHEEADWAATLSVGEDTSDCVLACETLVVVEAIASVASEVARGTVTVGIEVRSVVADAASVDEACVDLACSTGACGRAGGALIAAGLTIAVVVHEEAGSARAEVVSDQVGVVLTGGALVIVGACAGGAAVVASALNTVAVAIHGEKSVAVAGTGGRAEEGGVLAGDALGRAAAGTSTAGEVARLAVTVDVSEVVAVAGAYTVGDRCVHLAGQTGC